ncbi:MAG: amidohydrolase family protein, partial [Desulfobacterales bacterium]|nr:amidohydrolase family protein [Desulfobacterales bacterium]
GVRGLLCYEMSDRDGEAARENGLVETETFLEAGGPGLVGLHASFTVGDNLLKRAVDLAGRFDSGIHAHAAEDPADQDLTLEKRGKRVVERYKEAGVLDFPKTILSHCIHLNENERRLVRESNVWVVENIESNLNNNVGVTAYNALGDNIMLGVDGMHCDMLRSAKAAYFTGQGLEGIDMAGIYTRFRKAHDYLRGNAFPGDGENNLVIMDYDSPTRINADNFLGHFVYGLNADHIDGVVASGELIVKNKKLQTMDEEEILSFAREMGDRLWEKMKGK